METAYRQDARSVPGVPRERVRETIQRLSGLLDRPGTVRGAGVESARGYEVVDAKLAGSAKAKAVLQIA